MSKFKVFKNDNSLSKKTKYVLSDIFDKAEDKLSYDLDWVDEDDKNNYLKLLKEISYLRQKLIGGE